MFQMEHDIAAQHAENECLDSLCHHMADKLFVYSRNFNKQQEHIKKLEKDLAFANKHLLESQMSHISLDMEVVVLQLHIKDLESKWEWLNSQGEDSDKSMERVQKCLNVMDESRESLDKKVYCCNLAQKKVDIFSCFWSAHTSYLLGFVEAAHDKLDDVEAHLGRKIHCSHCPETLEHTIWVDSRFPSSP